jgi:ribosomal protein L12E/L44/L45/RPP1/RPP2
MKKILFALMLALPLSWSFAAIAQDAPAGGDAPKAEGEKKPEKKKGGKKKKDKKEEAPKVK